VADHWSANKQIIGQQMWQIICQQTRLIICLQMWQIIGKNIWQILAQEMWQTISQQMWQTIGQQMWQIIFQHKMWRSLVRRFGSSWVIILLSWTTTAIPNLKGTLTRKKCFRKIYRQMPKAFNMGRYNI
jgi:hypothetical protein